MIQLGLQRAAQLFRNNPQPWRAVHVAGTNGKGTVCAYLSALLHSNGITCGRFTSPHLIDRWDCITINEQPVSEALFRRVEADVLRRNRDENIQATEFEILTATAFDIFTRSNVAVAVVEVGMGGRDDATNILKSKSLAVITRVGLDHQAFLGNTLPAIAVHKCGIFARDVPIIYSGANDASVVDIIKSCAQEAGAGPLWRVDARTALPELQGLAWSAFEKSLRTREQQRIAIGQAWRAYRYLYGQLRPENGDKRKPDVMAAARDAIMGVRWPGRMQRVDIEPLVPGGGEILLDGAHNVQAAETLAGVVEGELRKGKNGERRGISWVIGSTRGRDAREFLERVLQPGDRVACVEFGPVEGMPWVQAVEAREIEAATRAVQPQVETACFARDIVSALTWAGKSEEGKGRVRQVVMTGSLYLASDVLRALKAAGGDIYGSGVVMEEVKKPSKYPMNKTGIYTSRVKGKGSSRNKHHDENNDGNVTL